MNKELVADPMDVRNARAYMVKAGALTDAELRQLQEHGNGDGFVIEVNNHEDVTPDQTPVSLDRSDDAASSATGLQTKVQEYIHNLAAWGCYE